MDGTRAPDELSVPRGLLARCGAELSRERGQQGEGVCSTHDLPPPPSQRPTGASVGAGGRRRGAQPRRRDDGARPALEKALARAGPEHRPGQNQQRPTPWQGWPRPLAPSAACSLLAAPCPARGPGPASQAHRHEAHPAPRVSGADAAGYRLRDSSARKWASVNGPRGEAEELEDAACGQSGGLGFRPPAPENGPRPSRRRLRRQGRPPPLQPPAREGASWAGKGVTPRAAREPALPRDPRRPRTKPLPTAGRRVGRAGEPWSHGAKRQARVLLRGPARLRERLGGRRPCERPLEEEPREMPCAPSPSPAGCGSASERPGRESSGCRLPSSSLALFTPQPFAGGPVNPTLTSRNPLHAPHSSEPSKAERGPLRPVPREKELETAPRV